MHNGDIKKVYRVCDIVRKSDRGYENVGRGFEEMYEVNEASLTHILGHKQRGYGIISACRASNDEKTNDRLTAELKKDLKAANLGYIPCYGGFKETDDNGNKIEVYEKSFFVPCHEMDGVERPFEFLSKTLIGLGGKYGQESVLLCPPDGSPRYVVTTPHTETVEDDDGSTRTVQYNAGDVTMQFDKGMRLNDVAQDYFTSINRVDRHPVDGRGKNVRRFTLESVMFPSDSTSYQQAHRRHARGEINRVAGGVR